MPNSYNLPGTPVVVGASPERRIEISGSGEIEVDGEPLDGPVVVDKAVTVTGRGYVVTQEVAPNLSPQAKQAVVEASKPEKKAPRKPRPSEVKAKQRKGKK